MSCYTTTYNYGPSCYDTYYEPCPRYERPLCVRPCNYYSYEPSFWAPTYPTAYRSYNAYPLYAPTHCTVTNLAAMALSSILWC